MNWRLLLAAGVAFFVLSTIFMVQPLYVLPPIILVLIVFGAWDADKFSKINKKWGRVSLQKLKTR